MTLSTLACTIDATGISAPTFDEILSDLQDQVRAIYGSDVAITPDTKDGQFLAVVAQSISDSNQAMINLYNSLRPSFAQGAALSSLVKINNIFRQTPSNSAADGDVIGVSGTTITNGVVEDQNGNKWNLPETVVIPDAGTISVTVTAQEAGAISAPAGSITKIATPTIGWQFFQSTTDALPGSPVESDAALRRRQASSAASAATANLDALLGALQALDGVTRVKLYENFTDIVDGNGLVAHSIAVVIEGGNDLDIATTIGQKKAPGCNLNGTTTQSYTDPLTGISYDGGALPAIKFYRLQYTPITVQINVNALDGWSSTIQAEIQQAVSDYINGLDIGDDIFFTRVYLPALLSGSSDSLTYEITNLLINGAGVDVVIPFDHVAQMAVSDVNVVVNP